MVRWKDANSGRWKAITGGRCRDEASILEAQVRQELLKGNDPSITRYQECRALMVNEVLDQFYHHSRYLSGTGRWQREARNKIENDIRPKLGSLLFSELGQEQIYRFYLSLKERGVSHATLEKYHGLLSIIGDFYMTLDRTQRNPVRECIGFRKRFPKQSPTRDINFLTLEELDRLYIETKRTPNRLLYPFIKFLSNSGLRRWEAYDLKWSDLDVASGFIHIRKSKAGRSRTIPLEAAAWEAIQHLRGRGDFIFLTEKGKRLYPDSYLRPLQSAARRAKLGKRVDLHTLRHSFGSNKIRMGWGLKKVSVILGHSDISITAKIYSHLLDGDLKVRDETRFGFDKKTDSADIECAKGTEEKMAQFFAQAITATLSNTAEGKRALMSLTGDLSSRFQQILATSGEFSLDSTELAQNSSFATLMLRTQTDCSVNEVSSSRSSLESSSDLEMLQGLKMEPMSGLEPLTYALRKRCSTN